MQAKIVTLDELKELSLAFDCIVVFGCAVYEDNVMSPMLEDRVKMGISVLETGVSDRLVLSGDGTDPEEYDEVSVMKDAVLRAGIDESVVQVDPNGLSTLESLQNLLPNLQGKRIVLVTQAFYLPRALYIADKLGITAYGVAADLRPYQTILRSTIREIPARMNAVCQCARLKKTEK